jgi:hypothetical protein
VLRLEYESWTYEAAPCECCPLASRCRSGHEACAQFEAFVQHGGRRWRTLPRGMPSRERYAQIFKEQRL